MKPRLNIQWRLVIYDLFIYAATCFLVHFVFSLYGGSLTDNFYQFFIYFVIVILSRMLFNIYHHIWRFEGVTGYMSLIFSDLSSGIVILIINSIFFKTLALSLILIIFINLVICLLMRLSYRYIYIADAEGSKFHKLFTFLMKIFASQDLKSNTGNTKKINAAIFGAGREGVTLAENLRGNPNSEYDIFFFIDLDQKKVGKILNGLKVYSHGDDIHKVISVFDIEEIIIAVPENDTIDFEEIYNFYSSLKCKVNVYTENSTELSNLNNTIKSISVEDLLQRNMKSFNLNKFKNYYDGKTVLITGGGGSIGSEIARQMSNFKLKKLVLLDIYENEVYNLKQDMLLNNYYNFDIEIEIASVTEINALDHIFNEHKPDIVIHAAAHKHVPLMEHNIIEAVKNNIFGTKNVIDMSNKYQIEKFMMLSTDKAVNPTNVMGASKRFCELLIFQAAKNSDVCYCATRFGNVLGSAGSVVPLFKKQIENGGPITITDKNVVRYFMTIPEASNLVINATANAKNSELFVLDMGQPVKIYDLAKKLISLSGKKYVEIIETGLRPGEKLYEEILVDSQSYKQTSNKWIYIVPPESTRRLDNINEVLESLKKACDDYDKQRVLKILKKTIPEFKDADIVNKSVPENL